MNWQIIKNTKVVLRVDFNVPMKGGKITDNTRIVKTLPLIKELREKNCNIVIISHLGRPVKPDKKYSLRCVAKELARLLNENVKLMKLEDVKPINGIVMLENIRFYAGETKNSTKLAQKLCTLGEYYINDAFGVIHRKHASVNAITHLMPSAIGPLIQHEIKMLKQVTKPKRPLVLILGGAKVDDKIEVILNLAKKASRVLVGGVMGTTLISAAGYETGKSKKGDIEKAKKVIYECGFKIALPKDLVVTKRFSPDAKKRTVKIEDISKSDYILDIGEETIKEFTKIISKAKTVFWNGPMGLFEWDRFSEGSKKIAEAVSKIEFGIIGGGDTISCSGRLRFYHISTGGGASLAYVSGGELPGLRMIKVSS